MRILKRYSGAWRSARSRVSAGAGRGAGALYGHAGADRGRQEGRQGHLLHGDRRHGRREARRTVREGNIPASRCRSSAPAPSACSSASARNTAGIYNADVDRDLGRRAFRVFQDAGLAGADGPAGGRRQMAGRRARSGRQFRRLPRPSLGHRLPHRPAAGGRRAEDLDRSARPEIQGQDGQGASRLQRHRHDRRPTCSASCSAGTIFEKLGQQDIMQVQSSTEPPKKLAQGERALEADGNEYNVFRLKDEGVPIKIVYPEEGTPLAVGNAAVLKKAPNPNAAKLFYAFLFSIEAQQLNSDFGGLRSFHPDVKEKADRTPLSQDQGAALRPGQARAADPDDQDELRKVFRDLIVMSAVTRIARRDSRRSAAAASTCRGRSSSSCRCCLTVLVVLPLFWLCLLQLPQRQRAAPPPSRTSPRWSPTRPCCRPTASPSAWRSAVGVLSCVVATPMAWLVARTDLPGRALHPHAGHGLVRDAALPRRHRLGDPGRAQQRHRQRRSTAGCSASTRRPYWSNIYTFTGPGLRHRLLHLPLRLHAGRQRARHACRPTSRTPRPSSAASSMTTLRKVTIPLVLPAMLAGTLIAILQALTMFGSPAILALPAGFHVITTKIWSLFQFPPRLGLAAAAALPLLIITIILLRAQKAILGRKGYTVLGGKSGTPRVTELGRWKWAAVAFVVRHPVADDLPALSGAHQDRVHRHGRRSAHLGHADAAALASSCCSNSRRPGSRCGTPSCSAC